ncbi:carboxylate--amine ligase [Actinomyces sp. HMT897]|uniref:carboxylate--amine ligase n=1 Tax=Actinomyces sp. HMT897 TaxID=2789424 RepID=UPI00190994AD|nr:carboxylate--amine ligase [Actinomyces sp. HMT897]QQO76853.1 carboxylate--amine ligase [Actinomyces sp. HMT897]
MSHVRPVVLGGDIGVYAIARQLHTATTSRVTVLSPAPIEAISLSSYIDVVPLPEEPTEEDTIAALLEVAEDLGEDERAVVMANTDHQAALLARHRHLLEPAYAVPFPPSEVIDAVSDKTSFSALCASVGVDTPRQVVVDMSDCDDPGWAAPQIDMPFPVVAKAAVGEAYDAVSFPGKRKIWFMDGPQELESLWQDLRQAGFRSTFVVQELIPGDNTAMRSVTTYVDSAGRVTLMGSARVLLEDHAPTMIGNPVAMVTEPFPEIWEAAERILTAAGYRGFANFDVKIDPRDGRALFFEVNPRIGRNSFYMTAAGANPMVPMIEDLIGGRRLVRRNVTREVLYSLVPGRLLMHYLRDPELAQRVRGLLGDAVDPLRDPSERSQRRRLVVEAQRLNHYRKFARYYPDPTDQSY